VLYLLYRKCILYIPASSYDYDTVHTRSHFLTCPLISCIVIEKNKRGEILEDLSATATAAAAAANR
jgi:hypothetical protein